MEFNTTFTKNQLCDFLMQKGVEEDDAKKLQEEKVDGETFQDISETDLKEIGVKLGSRKKIMKIIQHSKQSRFQKAEHQNTQILGGDSNFSNALVFDLVPAGSSCTTVLPTISSSTSLACSTTKLLPVSSTTFNAVKSTSSIAAKEKSTLPSSFLSTILPKATSSSSITDLCTEDASRHALTTYAVSQQSLLGNAELQNTQILGGDSNLSNALVFDLVPAGSSCTTVLPTISSTTSLACSTTKSLPLSSTTVKKVSAVKSTRNKTTIRKKSTLPSSFLSAILSEETSSSSITGLCTEDASIHALTTYAVPENINVLAMLDEHSTGRRIIQDIKSGIGFCKTDVNEIVRIVVRGMIDDLRSLYPTAMQKLNLAKALVRDIPELKSNREDAAGHEPFYDPRNNSGSIEWRLKTLRVRVGPEAKKNRRRKCTKLEKTNLKEDEEIVIDDEAQKKVDWLKSQPATEINKAEILKVMEETFNIRRNVIAKRSLSLADILQEFPILKEFDGALIDADFKLMFPNARNLLEVLPEYSEKIQIYVSRKRPDIAERVDNVADENFKAMMYLADLLPTPGSKKRKLEDDRLYHPSEMLVTFVGQENSTFSQEDLSNHPRLVCCGEIQEEQLQFFLILDNEYVDLGKCFIKAFDILYKSHKVFNLDYPKDLALFYNFLDSMIYKINTGVVRNSFEYLHDAICCVNT